MQPSLETWLDYIEQHVGFVLPKTQHQWLVNAIQMVADKLGVSTEELYQKAHHDDGVHQALIDGVVITESRFFRDKNALNYIGDVYAQQLQEQKSALFSVLSVGCSMGQETWSLAMVLDNKRQAHYAMTGKQMPMYQVLGLDVSQGAISTAKTAQYPIRTKLEVPNVYHHHLVLTEQATWQPSNRLRQSTEFFWCNVFDRVAFEGFAKKIGNKKPKLILCQNTLIYFRRFDQRDILDRLVGLLDEGGYLILGAAEAWFWQHDSMQRLPNTAVNVWQKLPAQKDKW